MESCWEKSVFRSVDHLKVLYPFENKKFRKVLMMLRAKTMSRMAVISIFFTNIETICFYTTCLEIPVTYGNLYIFTFE